jgi:hypothetical protein
MSDLTIRGFGKPLVAKETVVKRPLVKKRQAVANIVKKD